MKSPLHLAGMSVVVLVLAATLIGCGSGWQNYNEQFVRAGICRPGAKDVPEWVQGKLPAGDDEVYFVGRGIGYNVFDEQAAYEGAVNDAVEQMAKQVATWVAAGEKTSDARWLGTLNLGNRFLPGEHSTQALRTAARMTTQALVGQMAPRDVYWEQWYLQEKPEKLFHNDQRMTRYKCWVLMSVPKKVIAARVVTTLQALKASSARSTTFAAVGAFNATGAAEMDAAGAAKLYRMTSSGGTGLGGICGCAGGR